jgi:hypothetical protein
MPAREGVHLAGLDVIGNPFLLAIVARVLALGIAHSPERPNTARFIGKRAAPADTVRAHEHLDREFDLAALFLHRDQSQLPGPRQAILGYRPRVKRCSAHRRGR